MKNSLYPRIIPFTVFMSFIGLEEILRFGMEKKTISLIPEDIYYLYPFKILIVGFLLYIYRSYYQELNFRDYKKIRPTILSIVSGIIVFILWINMDWSHQLPGANQGYNPNFFTSSLLKNVMIFFRLFGAVIIVPIMEEIFWRSFFIRYLIDKDFYKLKIGFFTWPSFIISSIFFGLEHNLILAGIMAGIAYNLLLYYSKSLSQCILAHAVTNFCLGLYVLQTGQWRFW